MEKITLTQLKKLGACVDQVEAFERLFGKSVQVTEALCVECASVFDWDWAASHILTYAAWIEYEKVRNAARADYEKVRNAAWIEYEKVIASARAEVEKVRASTFARLYRAQT